MIESGAALYSLSRGCTEHSWRGESCAGAVWVGVVRVWVTGSVGALAAKRTGGLGVDEDLVTADVVLDLLLERAAPAHAGAAREEHGGGMGAGAKRGPHQRRGAHRAHAHQRCGEAQKGGAGRAAEHVVL